MKQSHKNPTSLLLRLADKGTPTECPQGVYKYASLHPNRKCVSLTQPETNCCLHAQCLRSKLSSSRLVSFSHQPRPRGVSWQSSFGQAAEEMRRGLFQDTAASRSTASRCPSRDSIGAPPHTSREHYRLGKSPL